MTSAPELNMLTSVFSLGGLGFNFLDWIIVLVFVFYIFEGFEVGFFLGLCDLLSFFFSFLLGLKFYSFVGEFLVEFFSFPPGVANAIGFFVVALIGEIILSIVLKKIFYRIKSLLSGEEDKIKRMQISVALVYSVNRFLGIIPGVLSAFILLSFLLTVIISLPFSAFLKKTVYSSRMGALFVLNTQQVEKSLNGVFGGALNETLNFLTIEPHGKETISLRFKTSNAVVDKEAEQEMLKMINKERTSRNLSALEFNEKLAGAARDHAQDMLEGGYFSHYTPEGLSPFDRLAKANIDYIATGENLAFSPNVMIAMTGFMNSPGHKANILSSNYNQVGIGVMDAGIYGEMFVQEFTN